MIRIMTLFIALGLFAPPSQAQHSKAPKLLETVVQEKIDSLPSEVATPQIQDQVASVYYQQYLALLDKGHKPEEIITKFKEGTVSVKVVGSDGFKLILADSDGHEFLKREGRVSNLQSKAPEKKIENIEQLIQYKIASLPNEVATHEIKERVARSYHQEYQVRIDRGQKPEEIIAKLKEGIVTLKPIGNDGFKLVLTDSNGHEILKKEGKVSELRRYAPEKRIDDIEKLIDTIFQSAPPKISQKPYMRDGMISPLMYQTYYQLLQSGMSSEEALSQMKASNYSMVEVAEDRFQMHTSTPLKLEMRNYQTSRNASEPEYVLFQVEIHNVSGEEQTIPNVITSLMNAKDEAIISVSTTPVPRMLQPNQFVTVKDRIKVVEGSVRLNLSLE